MAAPVLGLSPADLAGIRESLASGRQPRVVFTARAGQMAGNAGHVVELTDPTGSEEWIVVRFGRDELPFSPADLAVSGRRSSAAPVVAAPASPRKPRRTSAAAAPRQIVAAPALLAIPDPPAAKATQPQPRPPRQPKLPAPLVVTLTYADQRWTVAAQHGSKSLAKPFPIAPATAMRIVAQIEVPGVHEAIASILAAERAEAEHRAQRLRAELAEIESRLAELSNRA